VRAAATGEIEEIALTSTRKTIARRLTEAWQALSSSSLSPST
jgi:hypothetical protein